MNEVVDSVMDGVVAVTDWMVDVSEAINWWLAIQLVLLLALVVLAVWMRRRRQR